MRAPFDQYFTPRPYVEQVLDLLDVGQGHTLFEPTCGTGNILAAAQDRGAEVEGLEYCHFTRYKAQLRLPDVTIYSGDILDWEPTREYDYVVGNPPYANAAEVVQHLLDSRCYSTVALLLRTDFSGSKGRHPLFMAHPCSFAFVHGRISFENNIGLTAVDRYNAAWFIWPPRDNIWLPPVPDEVIDAPEA